MPITKLAAVLLSAISLSVEVGAQQSSDGSIGEVFATDANVRGSVVLAAGGTRVGSGSTVSAGRSAASLRLDRGGEVRVCPGTSVSLTAAAKSRGLLLSLNGGTIETHYTVGSSADTVQTPDFRILFPGPGDFHFAVSADSSGNACVRALEGNTASIVVAEMMGDGSYQVRPNEQITFSDGKVSNAVPFGKCGCAPAREALRANGPEPKPAAVYSVNNAVLPPPPIVVPTPEQKPAPPDPKPEPSIATAEAKLPQPDPQPEPSVAAAPPAAKPDEVHVQVDVPMVYSPDAAATNAVAALPGPPPAPPPEPAYLPADVYMALFRPVMDLPTVSPPAPPAKPQKEKKGFFGRLRSFFGGMFH